MNKLITLFLSFVSLSSFAQLNKTSLESNFPLLSLPYEMNTSMIPMYEPTDGKMNPKKYPFLKNDVTALVFGAMKDEKTIKKSVKTPSSKINAIGRFEVGKQNFIVYNLNDTKSDAYINVVYVASLDENYSIVDISNILFFAIFKNPDKSYRTTQIFRKASNNGDKLLLTEVSRAIKNVDSTGKATLNTQVSNRAYLFNKDGVIENIISITK